MYDLPTPYADRMAAAGDSRFARLIADLRNSMDEARGEAGRYWDQCPYTQNWLAKCKAGIIEAEAEARDRFDDLTSDPL